MNVQGIGEKSFLNPKPLIVASASPRPAGRPNLGRRPGPGRLSRTRYLAGFRSSISCSPVATPDRDPHGAIRSGSTTTLARAWPPLAWAVRYPLAVWQANGGRGSQRRHRGRVRPTGSTYEHHRLRRQPKRRCWRSRAASTVSHRSKRISPTSFPGRTRRPGCRPIRTGAAPFGFDPWGRATRHASSRSVRRRGSLHKWGVSVSRVFAETEKSACFVLPGVARNGLCPFLAHRSIERRHAARRIRRRNRPPASARRKARRLNVSNSGMLLIESFTGCCPDDDEVQPCGSLIDGRQSAYLGLEHLVASPVRLDRIPRAFEPIDSRRSHKSTGYPMSESNITDE